MVPAPHQTAPLSSPLAETGKQLLVAKYIGYKDFQHEVNLSGKDIDINVVMEETINELEAVMITAGAFTASDASRRTIFKATGYCNNCRSNG